MTSANSFIFEQFSQRWLTQLLQWNVSSLDSLGKEDIRNILCHRSSSHASCHVASEFPGKPPFVFEEHFVTKRCLRNPPLSSISYISYLLLPHVTSLRTWLSPCQALYMRGTSALQLFSPSIRLSSSHEMSHVWHGQWEKRENNGFIHPRAPDLLSQHLCCLKTARERVV